MKIQTDSLVTLAYRILDSEGAIFEEGDAADPLLYVHGHGELPPGVEAALAGEEPGTSIEVVLTPETGFGPLDPELIIGVPRTELGADLELSKGDLVPVEITTEDGEVTDQAELRVVEVRPDTVFLDGNHPLAGQDLTFHAEVLEVRAATPDELAAASHACDDPDHEH